MPRPSPAPGIRWDDARAGWIVRVAVGGRGHVRRKSKRFPEGTDPAVMLRWQRRARVELEDGIDDVPVDAAGQPVQTLQACADAYLRTVTAMPSYEARACDLAAWTRALGHRDVATLTAADFAGAWNTWKKAGRKANTLNHRRTALLECLRLTAPDVVAEAERGVRWQTAPRDAPRAIPYALIEEILQAMPVSVTQAWLRVRAYTGMAPSTLARLTAADVDLQRGTVRVPTRLKGGQVAGVVLPLIPQAVEAFRALKRMQAWGSRPSRQSVSVSWQRAVRTVSRKYEAAGEPPLPPMRPYDLRHSFATLVLDATGGDLQATMHLMQHRDMETTLSYTRARVSVSVQEAASKVAASLPAQGRGAHPATMAGVGDRVPRLRPRRA